MTRLEKADSRKRWREARALWNEWDPIGVFGIGSGCPPDEYEAYVGPSLRLLEQGAPTDELIAYLREVGEYMGLDQLSGAPEFARELMQWYTAKWPGTTA